MLIIYLNDVNQLLGMGIKLTTWLKGGKYRIRVLEILQRESCLSSELANQLEINRASMSRILRNLKEKNLVRSIHSGSRTVSYVITKEGRAMLKEIKRG